MFLIIKKKQKKTPPLWKLSFQLPNLLGEYLLTEEKKNSRCLLVSGGFSNKPLLFADWFFSEKTSCLNDSLCNNNPWYSTYQDGATTVL